jgi:hypothetical protein
VLRSYRDKKVAIKLITLCDFRAPFNQLAEMLVEILVPLVMDLKLAFKFKAVLFSS